MTLPIPPARSFGASLLLAREWELPELETRLAAAVEACYEPTWDDERGEFTWGLGLGEPHPRGQYNAFLAAAEAAGPRMWEELSAAPLEPCPQVVGVDFPAVALTQAEWVEGTLRLRLAPLSEDRRSHTDFRIVDVAPGSWDVDGPDGTTADWTPEGLVVRAPLVGAQIELSPGGS